MYASKEKKTQKLFLYHKMDSKEASGFKIKLKS